MKLFISWSGDLSHRAAIVMKEWLPVVLPFVDTWISSKDIPSGSRWGIELANELDGTDSGLVCIVPDNSGEPWLNFEAGALSKSVQRGRIHPFLLGVEPSQLIGPLAQFQATAFSRDEVHKLVRTINSEEGSHALKQDRVDQNFKICWPDLEGRLTPLLLEAKKLRVSLPRAASSVTTSSEDKITEEETKMLCAIAEAEDGLRADEAAEVLEIHPQRAKHILETLQEREFLDPSYNYIYGTSWHLSKTGRSFLISRKLL